LFELAGAEGIAKVTLRRAAKALGVKITPIHDGQIKGWKWSPPAHSSAPAGGNKNADLIGSQL
jgi:hypothetical protein